MNSTSLQHAALFFLAVILLGGPSAFTWLQNRRYAEIDARCAPTDTAVAVHEPERAAALARRLWARPDDADCLLGTYGMDRAAFLTLMEEIAADAGLSQRYAAAQSTP